MKTTRSIALLFCLASSAVCQELPNTPKPVLNTFDYVQIASLAGAHFGDILTTREFMLDPCRCFHEVNPIAPHTPSWGPLLAYHGAWVVTNTYVTYKLEKHHHKLLARELRSVQIGVEVKAFTSNQIAVNRIRSVKK